MSVAVDDASVYSHGESVSHTISDLQAAGEGEAEDSDHDSQHSGSGGARVAAGDRRDTSLSRDDDGSSMYPVTAGSVRSVPVEDESVDAPGGVSSAGVPPRFASLPSTLLAGPLDVVGEEVGSAGASAGGSEGHTADHGGMSMAGSDDDEGGVQGGGGSLQADDDEEEDDGDGELDEDEDCEDAVAGASVAVRPPRRRRGNGGGIGSTGRGGDAQSERHDTPPVFDENGEGHGADDEDVGGDGDSAAAAARGVRGGVYGDDVRPEDHEEEGEDMGASDLKGGAFVTFAAEADVMGHPHELQGGGGDMGAADQPGRAFEDADSDGASDDSHGRQLETEEVGGVSGLQDYQISLGTMGNRGERGGGGSVAGTSVGRVEGGSVLWADLVGTADAGGQVDLSPLPGGMEEPAVASVHSAGGEAPSRDARSDGGSSHPAGLHARRKDTYSPTPRRQGSAASDNSTVRSSLTGATRDPRALGHGRAPYHAAPVARGHRAVPGEHLPFERSGLGFGRHPVHSDVDEGEDDDEEDERHSFAAVASMGERAFTDQNHDGDSDSDSSSGQGQMEGHRRMRSGQRHTALGDTPLEAYDETKVLWRNHMSSNASTTALAEDGERSEHGHDLHRGAEVLHRQQPQEALPHAQLRVPSTRGSPPKPPVPPATAGSPLLALRSVLQMRSDVRPPVLPRTPDGEPNIWDADDGGSMDSAGAEVLAAALAASHAGAARPGSSSGGATSSVSDSASRPSSAQSAPMAARAAAAARAAGLGRGATVPARRPTSAVARTHHTASNAIQRGAGKPRPHSGATIAGGASKRPVSARARPGTAVGRPHSANASPKRRNKTSRAAQAEEDDFAIAHAVRAASRRPQASSRMQRLRHLVHAERTAAHRRAFDQEFDAEIPEMD